MRHFRSERNAVLIEVKERNSLLYFPDENKTTWRWSTAFVRVPDWQIPPLGQLLVVRQWRRFQGIHVVD